MSYTILTKQLNQPRQATILTTPDQVRALSVTDFYALDIETRGLDASDPASEILGIGLANYNGCFYIDLREAPTDVIHHLKLLVTTAKLTVFNALFDCTFLQAWAGKWPTVVSDSYALFKSMSTESWPGQSWSLATAIQDVLGWPTSNKTTMDAVLRERKLSKGDLWQLPPEILGEYCALDAEAAWQLHHVLMEQAKPFPHLIDYHTRLVLTEIRLLAEQQLRGIQIDQQRLESCRANNEAQIAQSMNAFLTHPDVAHHIGSYNKEVHAAWKAAEPPQFNKNGSESARWQAWRDREARHMADNSFNVNSKPQLGWLFYDKLGFKPLKFTETGRRVVDRKVLPALGEPGKMLAEMNLYTKRSGYIAATIAKSERDGCIHPQFNSVGTITGRLGGSGGWNAQQMPKTREFLESLRARPGMTLVQFDFTAIEPMILTEFSQDRTLLKIYGPEAAANQDIYLYIAAKIPALGKEIRQYYDPDHPTAEGIKAAKKHCKRQRQIAKTVQLAGAYGAGPSKIHETLVLGGVNIAFKEVRAIHADYWRLFSGVKRFEEQLKDMWESNRGWIPNALGRPIAIYSGLIKDIVNREVQSSAHDMLQLFIWNLDRLRTTRGLTWHPWIVDLHDEVIVECRESDAPLVAQSFVDALAATNAELGMGIAVKGAPQIADSLADIKMD